MEIKTYATHFCGTGGACYGLHQAGLEPRLAIDFREFIVKAREINLGHKALCMDISTYEPQPEHAADVLWTSPPCQTFSTSMRETYADAIREFKDTGATEKLEAVKNDRRNNLFLASTYYVEHFRPRFVVLENVLGLLTHNEIGDGNNTFTNMIKTFNDLGYKCDWNVLNSKSYGLPQDRDRVFIVGARDAEDVLSGELVYGLIPKAQNFEDHNPYVKFGTIMERGVTSASWGAGTYKTAVSKVQRTNVEITVVDEDDLLPTITCGWGGGATRKKVAILDKTADDIAFLRQPTIREGARAQGFPDSWVFPSNSTEAWTLIGNAVSSPVAEAIGRHLVAISRGERPPYEDQLWSPRIPNVNRGFMNIPPPDMFAH